MDIVTKSIIISLFIIIFLLMYRLLKLKNKNIRIGFGYDVHKLKNNIPLILCGTKINHTSGLVSFSDGDVATHALIDAILGASSQFDIGTNFPNDCDDFKNISSMELLKRTKRILDENKFKISNIDLTIVAQQPILKPYILTMKHSLSEILNININQISIKATTEEGLGFTGNLDGISAYCTALLYV